MRQKNDNRSNEKNAEQSTTSMRLDKYLKVSRIIKRRTVANDACGTGHVMINGKEAKPGNDVHVGDIISVRFGERLSRYEVVTLSQHVLKEDANGMYRVLSE